MAEGIPLFDDEGKVIQDQAPVEEVELVPELAHTSTEDLPSIPGVPQKSAVDLEMERKEHQGMGADALDLISAPGSAVGEFLVKNAPTIHDWSKSIADTVGIDTSQWDEFDYDYWTQQMLSAQKAHPHTFTNMMISRDSPYTRAIAGATADVFLDPLMYFNSILGAPGKAKYLASSEKAAKMADRFEKGQQALMRLQVPLAGVGVDITSKKILPALLRKGEKGIEAIGKATGKAYQKGVGKIAETDPNLALKIQNMVDNVAVNAEKSLYSFVGNSKNPAIREATLDYFAEVKAGEIQAKNWIDEWQHVTRGKSKEDLQRMTDAIEFPTGVKKKINYGSRGKRLSVIHENTKLNDFQEYAMANAYKNWADRLLVNEQQFFNISRLKPEPYGPRGYFSRGDFTPEFNNLTRNVKDLGDELSGFVPGASNKAAKQRKLREMSSVEANEYIVRKTNEYMAEKGIPGTFKGEAIDLNPVTNMGSKIKRSRALVARKRYAQRASETGLTQDEWAKLPRSQRARYRKFEISDDVKLSDDAPELLLKDKYFYAPDLDKIRYTMNLNPAGLGGKIIDNINGFTRLWRNLALFGPNYHMGNQFGNAMQATLMMSPKQSAQLYANFPKTLQRLYRWSRGNKKSFLVGGEVYTPQKLVNELAEKGLFDTSSMLELRAGRDLGPDMVQSINYLKGVKASATKKYNLFRINREFTELYADNAWKAAMYTTLRNSGYTKAGAAELVKNTLFRFDDVGPAFSELRKVFPFITHGTKMASTYFPRLVLKHPWMPTLYDRLLDLYDELEISEDPEIVERLRDLIPEYRQNIYNPVISSILPGKWMMVGENLQSFQTMNILFNMANKRLAAVPGMEAFVLTMLGRDPRQGFQIRNLENADLETEVSAASIAKNLTKQLAIDALPGWIKSSLSAVNPDWINDPYGKRVLQRMSDLNILVDEADKSLGEFLAETDPENLPFPMNLHKRILYDVFDEFLAKEDEDFYRHLGSSYRQHFKTLTLGLATLNNLDKEVLLRNSLLDDKLKQTQSALKQVVVQREDQQDPEYKKEEYDALMSDIKEIADLKMKLGKSASVIYDLSQKYDDFKIQPKTFLPINEINTEALKAQMNDPHFQEQMQREAVKDQMTQQFGLPQDEYDVWADDEL